MKRSQIAWWVGLAVSVSGALLGQAELIGEPYRHWLTIAFVAGTAVSGYMLERRNAKA